MTTKKVKKTGKYGVRAGVGIRKKYLLATKTDESKYVCSKCGYKGKIKRKAAGIYECSKCKTKITGGAYRLKTERALKGWVTMYYCSRCKEEYDEYPKSEKCKVCSGRIFFKKREPVAKKVKAD